MTEEVKLLLKALLAQAEESEAGQKKPYVKKNAPRPGIDTDEDDLSERKQKRSGNRSTSPETLKDLRQADLDRARKEMYVPHENNRTDIQDVPVWAKYALTLPEASDYFHLGYNKLREIVRKDKYAEYLLWNGGRVYIKRKLFEEFLNGKTEV